MVELRQDLMLPTQLGPVYFQARVTGPCLVEGNISLRHVGFVPMLPSGMSISACTAVLLEIEPDTAVQTIWLRAKLATEAITSACTGEHLDAQEWTDGHNLVVIGTEDGAALDLRYPSLGFADIVVVDFASHAMTLRLDHLRGLRGASFHFIIAENPDPEPVDSSAWFAVDQPHEGLLRLT